MKKPLLTLAIFVVAAMGANAQIVLTGTAPTYGQNFNTYAGSLATVPAGWNAGTATFQGTGTGSNTAGGAYAFGTGGDFSFGALRSGGTGSFSESVSFMNNTGSVINSITLSWDYEQWRFANISGFDVSGTGGLSGNATLNGKDFVGTASGTNGTVAVTPIASFLLSGLAIANGATFGISWLTTDASGSDNGISVDNFSLSATTVPEPTAAMLFGAGAMVCLLRRRRSP